MFILGSLLGQSAFGVQDYFVTAPAFFTRVVGLRYEERQRYLMLLQPGMPVFLAREPENRHDPRAMAVFSPWGAHLGYLRATLATVVSDRCSAGEAFSPAWRRCWIRDSM
ncbi:MAG TPA: hypothetical protein GXX25_02210 [Desulfotomaculum sp.]|nr:hypothetical protein [Desulfotomaculum sp.]